MLRAAEWLQALGDAGAHWAQVAREFGLAPTDERLGWFVGALRREGFLVQVDRGTISIPPQVPVRRGAWMRHPEHGVVKVVWSRVGFPKARVRRLGEAGSDSVGDDVVVAKEDLRGR